MKRIYEKKFIIRSFEVDFRGAANALTLLNYFQDIAGEHAIQFGLSLGDLFRKNKTWVLSRNHLKINRYPKWGEALRIRTWPSELTEFFALRDAQFIDSANRVIAVLTSSWMMLDLEKKRPIRLKEELGSVPVVLNRALEDDFPSLPTPETANLELPFRVRLADLDANRHVNNVAYVAWALETVPENILWSFYPKEIEVAYRGEVFYGEMVISKSQYTGSQTAPVFIHQLVRKSDQKELTRLRTVWKSIRK